MNQAEVAEAVQKLSERELQVLKRFSAGKRCNEIATELGLSVKTISTYLSRSQVKLGAVNNPQLLVKARVLFPLNLPPQGGMPCES